MSDSSLIMNFLIVSIVFVLLIARVSNAEKKFVKATTVVYPLGKFGRNFFNEGAKYSKELELKSNNDKSAYISIARAQDMEDVWLYENWFYGLAHGLIVESGGLDGLSYSTSFMFEKFANWTAIHIEADPQNFQELTENRENAININAALCNETKLLHYITQGKVDATKGFIEFMPTNFLQQWHKDLYHHPEKIQQLPTVQCMPFKRILHGLHIKHIDLWILDVEGAEESVLYSTDFKQVQINAIAMECDDKDPEKNQRKMNILQNHGFQCLVLRRNCMCKHRKYQGSSTKSFSMIKSEHGRESYSAQAPAFLN